MDNSKRRHDPLLHFCRKIPTSSTSNSFSTGILAKSSLNTSGEKSSIGNSKMGNSKRRHDPLLHLCRKIPNSSTSTMIDSADGTIPKKPKPNPGNMIINDPLSGSENPNSSTSNSLWNDVVGDSTMIDSADGTIPTPEIPAQFIDFPLDVVNLILAKLPPAEAAVFPFISEELMDVILQDPCVVSPSVRLSGTPLHLEFDVFTLANNLFINSMYFPEMHYYQCKYRVGVFVDKMVDHYKDEVYGLNFKRCRMKALTTFKSLKVLKLFKVLLPCASALIKSCPALQDLCLEESLLDCWFKIHSNTSSVTSLLIHNCRGHKEGVHNEPLFQFSVRLPNLIKFSFIGPVTNPFTVTSKQLDDVSVSFRKVEDYMLFNPVVHQLMFRFRAVKKLDICNTCIQSLDVVKGIRPVRLDIPFSMLEELVVNCSFSLYPGALGALLSSVPKLTHLYVEITHVSSEKYEYHWETVRNLFPDLIYLQVRSFMGGRRELQFLGFILGSSPGLLKATIIMLKNSRESVHFREIEKVHEASKKEILLIQKASKVLEIEILDG